MVVSAPVLGASESLCPEDIPAVVTADDDEGKEQERSSPSPTVVNLSPSASVVPGIIQVIIYCRVFFFRVNARIFWV